MPYRLGARHRQLLALLERFPRGFGLAAFNEFPTLYVAVQRAATGLELNHGRIVRTFDGGPRHQRHVVIRPAAFEPRDDDAESITEATATIRRELHEHCEADA